MSTRKNNWLMCLFFVAGGAVCAGPVMGADEQSPEGSLDSEEFDGINLFEDTGDDLELPQGQSVEVGSFGHIDLHVKDLDLTKVLQLLSIQSQRNIVATRNVAGSISADLYGVDFYDALDAILEPNGFGYMEKGNFIYVYTADELEEQRKKELKPETKIVRLNYISGADVAAFVQPLLSSAGTISVSADVSQGFQPSISDGGANTLAATDTLVVRDYPENIEEIMAVITDLDVKPKQVLVEASILQARLTENNAFGVDFSFFGDVDIADFTSPLGVVDDLISGAVSADSANVGSSTVGNTAAGASGLKLGFLGNDFAVFVRALDSVTDTTVLANPKALVLNRQRADLLVGEKLGYLSTTATDTSTTQTVEFLEVGTQLTVRPFISEDDTVRMELRPSLSDGTTSLVGGFVIPNETTQELVTNVMVKSGQTVVIGGLFTEDTTVDREQVPVAGDIPIVGYAFQGQDDTVERSEVIFLIKPTVMKDQELVDMGDEAVNGIDAARIGARKGLLPWSRTKMVNGHLKNAMKHMKNGNDRKAMWSVDCALYLNPQNVDARRLKQELTGETTPYYDFSILEEAVDNVIGTQLDDYGAGIIEIEPDFPSQGEPTETDTAFVSQEQTGRAQDSAFEGADESWEQWEDAGAAADGEQFEQGTTIEPVAETAEVDQQFEFEPSSQFEQGDEFEQFEATPDATFESESAEAQTYNQSDWFTTEGEQADGESDGEMVNVYEFVDDVIQEKLDEEHAGTENSDDYDAFTEVVPESESLD